MPMVDGPQTSVRTLESGAAGLVSTARADGRTQVEKTLSRLGSSSGSCETGTPRWNNPSNQLQSALTNR